MDKTSESTYTAFSNVGSFVSFAEPLKVLCREFQFKKVLEFGPGTSTKIVLENTDATILSIEAKPQWYEKYASTNSNPRVDLRLLSDFSMLCDEIKETDFNLIFVDGGDRVDALHFARTRIAEGGIVYIHDAHREDYESGILAYPYHYFCERHSSLLFADASLYQKLVTILPCDEVTHSKYSISPERQSYFKRMKALEIDKLKGQ